MKKIQAVNFNLRACMGCFAIILSIVTTNAQPVQAKNKLSPEISLSNADSLFRLKQYTQSLALYHSLYNNSAFSPAMLLRMAYIEEGLGHIAQTELLLNQYYLATYDPLVQAKMEDLANKNRLEGYANSDGLRIMALAGKYYGSILLLLGAAAVFLFSFSAFLKFKRGIRPTFVSIALVAVVSLMGLHAWFSAAQPEAIVMNDNTYIMEGPSAGAPVAAIIGSGHRIKILGTRDIWVKLEWNGKLAFVREGDVKGF